MAESNENETQELPEGHPLAEAKVEAPKPGDELGPGGKKALAAEREARDEAEKTAKNLAARLKDYEDREKTEEQRRQEKFDELSTRASTAESERDRLLVIAEYEIPKDYQDLVQGATPDLLAKSAAKVRELIAKTAENAPTAASYVIPDEGTSPALALNGDGLEKAIKQALGIA